MFVFSYILYIKITIQPSIILWYNNKYIGNNYLYQELKVYNIIKVLYNIKIALHKNRHKTISNVPHYYCTIDTNEILL